MLLPSPGEHLNPRAEPTSPASLALAGGFFTAEPPGKLLHICRNPKNTQHKTELLCKFWMWVISSFISCNKPPLVEGVDNEGGYAPVGDGGIWEISVPFTRFCCEPNTGLKVH